MTTATVPTKLLVVVALVVMLVLGVGIGYVIGDPSESYMQGPMMSGIDGSHVAHYMSGISSHMGGMDGHMGSMTGPGTMNHGGHGYGMPSMHGHD